MIGKLSGCALLLLFALGVASLSFGHEKRRLAVLDGWIAFLTLAKAEIECNLTPLKDLIQKADPAFTALLSPRENTLQGYFDASKNDLDQTSRDALAFLLVAFGSQSADDLLVSCSRCLDTLSRKRLELACELPKKKKQRFAFSVSAACLVILLLW